MARRKRRASSRSRRRRVSGIKSGSMERLLGLVAGAAATGLVNKIIPDSVNPKIAAAAVIAAGVFVPGFAKGNALIAGVGDGMVAAGGLTMLREFGVVSGLPIIAGYRDLRAINGMPQQLESFVEQPAKKTFPMSQVINGMGTQFDENRD